LKYVLSERRVSVDTLKEEKHFSDRLVKSEGAGILRKSSKVLEDGLFRRYRTHDAGRRGEDSLWLSARQLTLENLFSKM